LASDYSRGTSSVHSPPGRLEGVNHFSEYAFNAVPFPFLYTKLFSTDTISSGCQTESVQGVDYFVNISLRAWLAITIT